MTNYKVLPFTEENLKLEGAEVFKCFSGPKALHVLPLKVKGEYLIYWDDETFSHYPVDVTILEIRIPVKQYTVAEVWDEVKTHQFYTWDENDNNREWQKVQLSFARRIAELAKADQLKLD